MEKNLNTQTQIISDDKKERQSLNEKINELKQNMNRKIKGKLTSTFNQIKSLKERLF